MLTNMTHELQLIHEIAQADDVYELRHFTVYRKNRALDLTILDRGEGSGQHRFTVEVRGANEGDNENSVGHGEATLEDALHSVNWWVFD